MSKQLIVTAPAVQLLTGSGAYVHLYEGGFVPSDADGAQVKHLREVGMIGELAEPVPASSGVPAKSANKGEWEAYARSQGATDADLDGKSKDDLVAAYGDKA